MTKSKINLKIKYFCERISFLNSVRSKKTQLSKFNYQNAIYCYLHFRLLFFISREDDIQKWEIKNTAFILIPVTHHFLQTLH